MKKLSSKSREILEQCAQEVLQRLNNDHWIVMRWIPRFTIVEVAQKMERERQEIQTAIKEMNAVYTEQHTK